MDSKRLHEDLLTLKVAPTFQHGLKTSSFAQLLQAFRARLKLLMPPASIIDEAATQFPACV